MREFELYGTVDVAVSCLDSLKGLIAGSTVDFGHLNARDRGVFYTVDDYKRVFDRIASELGSNYAEDLHCHFSKIMFTEMGEKKHLTFDDDVYGPNFELLAEAIVSLGVAPTIICESAGTQSHDAAFMKLTYEKLRQN